MEERQLDRDNSFSFTAAYNFYKGIIPSSQGKIQKNMTHFVFEKGWQLGEKKIWYHFTDIILLWDTRLRKMNLMNLNRIYI